MLIHHTLFFLLQKYVARITYLDILRDGLRLALLELLHLLRGQHPQPVLPPVQHQRLVQEDRVKVRGAEDLLGGGKSRAAMWVIIHKYLQVSTDLRGLQMCRVTQR